MTQKFLFPAGAPRLHQVFLGAFFLCLALSLSAASPSSDQSSPGAATPARTGWWSLEPLARPTLPVIALPAGLTNPVDRFIRARLADNGLQPSPEAPRPILIRRLYFDLIGLPPTPEEVRAFVQDTSPDAYNVLVDRLLSSPHYGERWARHWLDVVHYGETHGYDKDQPRPNAWPYRDYVIRSFNRDKPYSRFVQEQLAGDILFPDTRDGFEALGFISAGPWDLIGHAEVAESKIDGKIARHLDRDDMVANTIQTFNSLTVQCAQCHDHKFDPIPQQEYYSLQSVFAALDRADQTYDQDENVGRKRKQLIATRARLESERKQLQNGITARAGSPLADIEAQLATLQKAHPSNEAFGYHSAIEKSQDTKKWVQVDLGMEVPISKITLFPCKDDFNSIGEGFGFPVQFILETANDPSFTNDVNRVADLTGTDLPNPKLAPLSFDAGGKSGRYVRVTATRLALRQEDYIFALAELTVLDARGNNVSLRRPVTALDSIEAPARWQRQNLTDGLYPGASVEHESKLALLKKQRETLLAAATSDQENALLSKIEEQLSAANKELDALPAPSKAFVGSVYTGSGAFAGTGASGGKPRPVFVLDRGNIQKPGREVTPGALSCVPSLNHQFALPADHSEADRRAMLARWLTDKQNPLTWRSIVNRVWQYHFGRGLVETPNDFGRMGARPTHPELLDWLAVQFRDGGQSLKALHRLLVTSATYRQVSTGHEANEQLDADNRFLWRANRRKLEAEAVRDAILSVSGKLDLKMGGPSFRDFIIEHPEHSPHYQYHLHDPDDPASHRRSIYRLLVRSQQQPFLTTLDCADPSMQVARRNESVSPLQSLALLNNNLVLAMSGHFAAKLSRLEQPLPATVSRAFEEAVGRPPSDQELSSLHTYARQHGLTNLCRLLFNLNEFAFVD